MSKYRYSFQQKPITVVYDDPLSGVFQAVFEANLEKVKELILENRSPNISDNHGNTPLHIAVIKDLSDILDYLLSLDTTEVNVRNLYGETPLFLATKHGKLHLVDKLVSRNANVNLCNLDEVSPLHFSVKYPEVAHLIIKNGANVDAVDSSGKTPLHEAVNENCLETLCMLLYYNADANIGCDENITPFMKAIILENAEMQSVLIDYVADFNDTTKDCMTTLNLGLTHVCPYVEEIISRGADVNYQHEVLNSFSMCLQVPNKENMKLIWPHFKYQPLLNTNFLYQPDFLYQPSFKSYLEMIIIELNQQQIQEYLRIIIDSGNLSPIFKNFNFTIFYQFLDERVKHKESWLQITSELICLYLCEGNALDAEVIGELHMLFGYSELLRICLHMDLDMTYCVKQNTGLLLCDPLRSVDNLKTRLFHYHTTPVSIKPFLPYVRVAGRVTSYDLEDHGLTDKLQGIPSLLELARNATRDHLVSKFDLSIAKRYYLFVQNMCISTIYKDILTFKKAIYK